MKKLLIDEDNIISNFQDMITILNLGAGRTLPIDFNKFEYPFLVSVDNNYLTGKTIEEIERSHDCFNSPLIKPVKNSRHVYKCKYDIYKFLESYHNTFDMITIYRFLEHVEFTNVSHFIYLLSQSVKRGGLVDIIVPNYKTLAEMILDENLYSYNFNKDNILVTTELLNEPNDPHASIWTYNRIKYFFGLEGRFRCERIIEDFEFEDRNIYIRAIIRRL